MILYISPNAPLLVRAGATAILALHIGGGATAIVSGAIALVARKGGVLHRMAGTIFVAAMLVMAGIGVVVSPFLPTPQMGNVAGGALACYLAATGWAAVRRKEAHVGVFEVSALFIATAVAATMLLLGFQALKSPSGELVGVPYQAIFILGGVASLLAASDVSVILRGGVSGVQRIARHLWRMCAGLFIATGSALTQQRIIDLIPHALHRLPILLSPALLVLVVMGFWLVRIRFRPVNSPSPAPLAEAGTLA